MKSKNRRTEPADPLQTVPPSECEDSKSESWSWTLNHHRILFLDCFKLNVSSMLTLLLGCVSTQRLTLTSDRVSDTSQGRCVLTSGSSGAVLQMLLYMWLLSITLENKHVGFSGLLWSVSDRRHYRPENPKYVWFLRDKDAQIWLRSSEICWSLLLFSSLTTEEHTWTQILIHTICVSVYTPLTRLSHFALQH